MRTLADDKKLHAFLPMPSDVKILETTVRIRR
jgi:hypothetical protein